MTYLAINIGNFHPILVHLPIGILIFAFLLEVYQRLRTKEDIGNIIKFAIAIGVLSAIGSIVTGLFLEDSGSYDEDALFRHKWMGIGMTVIAVLLFFAKDNKNKIVVKLYFPMFMVVMVMLTIAGHWGGNMTHGEGFLTKDIASNKIIIEDVNKALVYNDIVQPILDNKCVSCHNPKKTEGKLLLTGQQELLLGGESGSLLDSSASETPLLLHRVQLPLEDEEHMPPKGKVQLTDNEVALLHWWMENDNCFDCITSDLERNKKIQSYLNDLEEDTSIRALLAKDLNPVDEDWLSSIKLAGISLYPLEEGSPLYSLNLANREDLSEDSFKRFKKYAENIVELNLGHSNFQDSLASSISIFENLTKLQLQNTTITDKTLDKIQKLAKLESLNLYATEVSDDAIGVLKKLPNLKDLYLWQTNITDEGIAQLTENNPTFVAHQINKEIFAASAITPPLVIVESNFIKDSLAVEMATSFENASIFYTTDNSEPDTTSTKYSEPFLLKETTTVKAISHKEGWGKSEVVITNFKRSTIDYEDIVLNKAPSEKYQGKGAKTLIDLERGSERFVDGKWLGYEASHFSATFKLKDKKEISSISVGALSAPTNWIFHPSGFKIWVSDNGQNFKRLHTVKLPEQEPSSNSSIDFFDIELPKVSTKYVRIQVESVLKNPSWHQSPGGKSWLFVDEILIN
ncbi:chitobiase/beta-hexosaminidase C-terminal domain-containing protein [uncultured Croceitalea sp.]|uniref:chitobiase/beta-hexosaminidase C-terminal domain-containing protein n=1 Tax=uncultured Croceitalea sp. TaxID=1798908 RepID=UPI003305D329